MDEKELMEAGSRLNAEFGQGYKRRAAKWRPPHDQAISEQMLAFQEQERLRFPSIQEIDSKIKMSILESRNGAASIARDNHPKPACCERCSKATPELHAHHITPYAKLKALKIAHLVEAHEYEWLCVECHRNEHKALGNFIKYRSPR